MPIPVDVLMKFGFILAVCTNVSIVLFVAFAIWSLNNADKKKTRDLDAASPLGDNWEAGE